MRGQTYLGGEKTQKRQFKERKQQTYDLTKILLTATAGLNQKSVIPSEENQRCKAFDLRNQKCIAIGVLT